jgi:pimeloyl-ACP methyl ester carboxylesterase
MSRHLGLSLAAAIAAFVSITADQAAGAASLETLTPRPGVSESFILLGPESGKVAASVILLTGGSGRLNLAPERIEARFGNFLVRSRHLFAEQGLQVAVLDSPSDHRDLDTWRASETHAGDIAAVIRFLRQTSPAPVWLVGTSMGTVSAASAAAYLVEAPREERPDGIVLTSSVTTSVRGAARSTVYSGGRLEEVAVPVLLVHHLNDGCKVSPPGGVTSLARAFAKSPKVETMYFDGGSPPRSDPCEPFAPHGYFGIEPQVVAAIAAWIKAHGRAP